MQRTNAAKNFAVAIFAVVVIIMEPEQSGLMQRPPRNVNQGIASGKNIVRWLLYGAVLFLVSFAPLWFFGDRCRPSRTSATSVRGRTCQRVGNRLMP